MADRVRLWLRNWTVVIGCVSGTCFPAHADASNGPQGEHRPPQAGLRGRVSIQLSTPARVYRVIDRRIEVHAQPGGALVAEIMRTDEVRALHAARTALFVADQGGGVSILDLRDVRRPIEHGRFAKDQLVGSFAQTGDELQLRSPSGLTSSWYDISEPLRPRFLRRLSEASSDDDEDGKAAAQTNPSPSRVVCTLRLRDGQQITGTALPDTPEGYRAIRVSSRSSWVISPSELVSATQSITTPAGGEGLAAGDGLRCGDPLDYDVDGAVFTISRVSARGRITLGRLRLPWTSQPPVLLHGRAAFVPLVQGGVAVIDIALSRYPYVAWRLAREQTIRALRLEHDSLILTTQAGELSYDIHDALRPIGPQVSPAQPLRLYQADSLHLLNSDESWGEPQRRWAALGRRVYVQGGPVLLGHLWQIDSFAAQIHLDLGAQLAQLPISGIQHIEPVELAKPQWVGGLRPAHLEASTALSASPPPLNPQQAKLTRRNEALEISMGIVAVPAITVVGVGLSIAILGLLFPNAIPIYIPR